jgi:hypothetical protein
MEDEIEADGEQVDVPAQRFAHAALDAIALVRFADNFPHGESNAWTVSRQGLGSEEPAHGRGLPFAGCGVGALVVSMLAQTRFCERLEFDSFSRCGQRFAHGAKDKKATCKWATGKGSIRNGRAKQHIPVQNWKIAGKGGAEGERSLVAEASTNGDALTADGTAAAEYGSACFGLHARPESVNFYTAVAVRLKCALGHGNALLLALKNLRFDSEVKYSKM